MARKKRGEDSVSRTGSSAQSLAPYTKSSYAIDFGLRVEDFVLHGEDGSQWRAEIDRWYAFYRATSPMSVTMIGSAFHALIQLRRVREAENAHRQIAISTVEDEWDDKQEDQVREYKSLLERGPAPADAVLGLSGFAAGCRWQINRWQRLKGLLEKDGTWYGRDRDEAIRLQGAAPDLKRLCVSEAAYLTFLYCLLAQPIPNKGEIAALAVPEAMPLSLRGKVLSSPSTPKSRYREWLHARIENVLPWLRQREEQFWVKTEEPARTAIITQALAEIEGTLANLEKYRREAEKRLKRNLVEVVRQAKRDGIVLPPGVPYELP